MHSDFGLAMFGCNPFGGKVSHLLGELLSPSIAAMTGIATRLHRNLRLSCENSRFEHIPTSGGGMSIEHLRTREDVDGFSDALQSPDRKRPFALVSVRQADVEPIIDVELIDREAGHAADIFVIQTGHLTYRLTDVMPEGFSVFGGAGRVYPPGRDWHLHPYRSKIWFAYGPEDTESSARGLIRDILTHPYSSPLAPAGAKSDAAEVETLRRRLKDEQTRRSEQVSAAKKKAVRTEPAAPTVEWTPDLFVDLDDATRFALLHTWVHRVSASEKTAMPLGDFLVGSSFSPSIDKLDAGQRTKALRCAVDVLTDRVREMPARELHVLRSGMGGDDPPVTRADGAVCWRASVESKTAAALRLHFWRLPDGRAELSRVVTHDDFTP